MKQFDLEKSRDDSLAKLLSIGPGGLPIVWSDADLAALLAHQMRARLGTDLPSAAKGDREIGGLDAFLNRQPDLTFADLLCGPAPQIELLQAVKEFAKSQKREASELPVAVATVIYYAAIFAALLRRGSRISNLCDEDLRQGLQWARGRTWLDARLRELFDSAERHFAASQP